MLYGPLSPRQRATCWREKCVRSWNTFSGEAALWPRARIASARYDNASSYWKLKLHRTLLHHTRLWKRLYFVSRTRHLIVGAVRPRVTCYVLSACTAGNARARTPEIARPEIFRSLDWKSARPATAPAFVNHCDPVARSRTIETIFSDLLEIFKSNSAGFQNQSVPESASRFLQFLDLFLFTIFDGRYARGPFSRLNRTRFTFDTACRRYF